MKTLKNILAAMRPLHWIKNLLVFSALFFQPEILGMDAMWRVIFAFVSFCMLSSGIYILNDLFDRDRDKLHPEKRHRPIASGELSISSALMAGAVLMVAGMGIGWKLGMDFLTIIGMYLCLNVAYSAYLKNLVIIDAFMVATGFVLRVVGGAEVINAPISFWIVLCTVLASLFLTFSKRRHELTYMENAGEHRLSLAGYDPYFLDQMIAVVTAGTVIVYVIWTRDPMTMAKFGPDLAYTIPFVCYGVFRYLYIVHRKQLGGDPTRVFLTDVPLIINLMLWALTVGMVLYS